MHCMMRPRHGLPAIVHCISTVVGVGSGLARLFPQFFHSRSALVAENLFLRKQLAFYQERKIAPRRLTDAARFSLVLWSRLFNWRETLVIVRPETLIGWHRKGFRLFWKWKSKGGRPRLPRNVGQLIAEMAIENPTWGEERVANEPFAEAGDPGFSAHRAGLLA